MRTTETAYSTFAIPQPKAKTLDLMSRAGSTVAYTERASGIELSVISQGTISMPTNMPTNQNCSNRNLPMSLMGQAMVPVPMPAKVTSSSPNVVTSTFTHPGMNVRGSVFSGTSTTTRRHALGTHPRTCSALELNTLTAARLTG